MQQAATWRLNCAAMLDIGTSRPEAFASEFSPHAGAAASDPSSNAVRIIPMAWFTNSSCLEEDLVEFCALTVDSR
jgi:hypothetical protein